MKVIIIDDEPLVRLGLKSIIPWEDHGCEIVGEATNGRQGLELILKYRPNLVITDIKMPVMDGLEMMRQVFKSYHPAFIILSSYNDFPLVKQAMKQGAEDYLIKLDLEPDILLNILAAVKKKMSETGGSLEYVVRENNFMLREGFFKRIVGRSLQDPNEIELQLKHLEIELNEAFLAGMMIRLHQSDLLDKYEPDEYCALEGALRNMIEEITNDLFQGYTYTWNRGEFFTIFSYHHPGDWESFTKKARDTAERMVYSLKQYFNVMISVGISDLHHGYEQIYQVHQESHQAVQYGVSKASGMQKILFYKDLPASYFTRVQFDISEFKIILPQAVEFRDLETIQTIFDTIISNLHEMVISREQAFDICFQLTYLISGTGLSETTLKEIIGYHDSLTESILNLETLSDIVHWLTNLGQGLCRFLSREDEPKNHRLITKAKKYIAEHYTEEISLNELAAAIHISSGYLSTIFKQYAGVSFIDYLTDYKIGQAKRMLRETDCKIYEIAEMLGYQNAYYFSKVFKKVTGMTPSEFIGKKM